MVRAASIEEKAAMADSRPVCRASIAP
jgi:hypothetical protein